jgi:two-component system, OmpR family, response regulator
MTHLLLVDDDKELSGMLREYLEQEGFAITLAGDGESGAKLALSGQYDLAILDVMMPRLNGVDTLARIRAHNDLPVIMLTAKGDDVDRIIGLEMGADDYVPKPCTPRELVARIRAVLRRYQAKHTDAEPENPIITGDLRMCPQTRTAEWKQQALELTSTEFNLLAQLARNAGKAVSKSDLSELAMGRPLTRFDRSIDVHMSRIRQKLGNRDDGQTWIQTIRNVGYQLTREQA